MQLRKWAIALLAAGMMAAPAGAAEADKALGIWRNPKNSVHIRLHPCADRVCGTVIWANAKALADAREGGTPVLVGTQLFRDFRQVRKGQWKGKVFVPDLGRTFTGTMVVADANTIKGKGCLVAGLICKSQTWTRIP